MFEFIKKKYAKTFNEAMHKLQVSLYADLVKEFGDSESSKKISAQAVNYLTGTDFLNQTNVSPEIIGEATKRGLQKLDNDEVVREIVVELNKGIVDFKKWKDGSKYSIDSELQNVKDILSIYYEQYPKRFELIKFEKMTEAYSSKFFNPTPLQRARHQ